MFFIKRFALTLDPILIVLLKLTIFRQNSKLKSGGQAPTEIKVGWPVPMRSPRSSATYATER